MNKEYSEKKLRGYITKCFQDAFKSEQRAYDESSFDFDWIMIKNKSGIWQLYLFARCRYNRVLTKVLYRVEHNLMKNFGIHYGDTNELRCLFYDDGIIVPNFTQAMFKTRHGRTSLSIFDKSTNIYENDKLHGECMAAYVYEKLLFKYWDLTPFDYERLSADSEKRYLPDNIRKDWEAFKKLYNETFNKPICEYEIICSEGVTRL